MENNCLALLLPTSHVLQKQLQAACRIPRLQRAQVKAPLPQANSSQGGGGPPLGMLPTPVPLHCAWWRRSTLLELLNTSQTENPTDLQETSETSVLMRQGTPFFHSTKYSHYCFPVPKDMILHTYLGSKAGAESSHRPLGHDMKIFWARWSLYPSTDVALQRAVSCCLLAAPSNLNSWQHPALHLQHQKDFTSS